MPAMSHITDNVEYLYYRNCPGHYYFVAFKTNAGYTVIDVKTFTRTLDGGFLIGNVVPNPLYPNAMPGAMSNTITD